MAVGKLVQYLANHYKVDARHLDALVKRLKDAPQGSESKPGSALNILAEIDRHLRNSGVEYVRTDNGRWAAYYSNSGDSYGPTVMIQTRPRRSIIVGGDWGSYVERYEP